MPSVEYSFAAASTVDVTALSASRFLVQRSRQLPYRDAAGRVNVPLLEASVKAIDAGAPCPEEMVTKARAWLRHARKDDENHDEQLTLEELLQAHLNKRRAPELTAPDTAVRPNRRAPEPTAPDTAVRPNRRAPLKRLRRGYEEEDDDDDESESTSEEEVGPRQIWCALCCELSHVDNFSGLQRRAPDAKRRCLKHTTGGRGTGGRILDGACLIEAFHR